MNKLIICYNIKRERTIDLKGEVNANELKNLILNSVQYYDFSLEQMRNSGGVLSPNH